MRNACRVCENFTNYYADISFGGLASQQGLTTTLIRTKAGEKIYTLALNKGYVNEPAELNTSLEKSKMIAQIISFSKRKSRRAEEYR